MSQPIRVVDATETEWRSAKDLLTEAEMEERGGGEVTSRYAMHLLGDAGTPQLYEVEYEPGAVAPPHAHPRDEIVFVVAGSLELGRRSLGPGSSVYVPANTLYSFRAGPDGLRFANFRPTGGTLEYISKPEFMRRRATSATPKEGTQA